MKRIVCLFLAVCLILLGGCGKSRDSGEAGGDYNLSWKELRDNGFLLTLQSQPPEGYTWQIEAGGVVTVDGPQKNKNGYDTYKVSAKKNGKQIVNMNLTSEDDTEFVLYSYELVFNVDAKAVMTLESCTVKTNGSISTIGEGEHAIHCLQNESYLLLILDEADWQYRSENEYFLISPSQQGENTVLTVYRESESTVLSSYAMLYDTENYTDTEKSDYGKKMDEYYAEKDGVVIVESEIANATYTLNVHMDSAGVITLTDYAATGFTGSSPMGGAQIFYDETTGVTRIWVPDDYQQSAEEQEPTLVDKAIALHAETYIDRMYLYEMTPEDFAAMSLNDFLEEQAYYIAEGSEEEATQLFKILKQMEQYQLDELRWYLADLELAAESSGTP